jgi:hypothetical protein
MLAFVHKNHVEEVKNCITIIEAVNVIMELEDKGLAVTPCMGGATNLYVQVITKYSADKDYVPFTLSAEREFSPREWMEQNINKLPKGHNVDIKA